jgi:hypothetical protein
LRGRRAKIFGMVGLRALVVAAAALLAVPSAYAARVDIPLRVPLDSLREALGAQLRVLYRENGCRYLNVESPRLEALHGRLHLESAGSAALGIQLGDKCGNALSWQGSVQFTLAPWVDSAGRLRLRIVDSGLTDARGGKAPFIWDLSKRYLHPRLERFSYDIGASRSALVNMLSSAAPAQYAAAMGQALRGIQVREPRVDGAEIVVPLALQIPDAWLAAPAVAASNGPLSDDEIEALEKALEPWDAFLVYVVRQAALDADDNALRERLFTLLLDSRYRLIALLSGDEPATGDPVRTLFVDAWNELRTIIVDARRDGVLPASLLRYAAFVDAGDALMALEQAAPGLALSSDGLRQLARSLSASAGGNPLAYDWSVDPELRRLFKLEEIPDVLPPPALPKKSWLELFVGRAYAASDAAPPALDRWVPTAAELPAYETRVGELVHKAAATELGRTALGAPYDRIYANLVPTTALIESCWRQYVVRRGKVTYLRSPSGSIGIMQVNQHVWRGFYDIERLRWDTAYNIRAGASILMRYVKDYAIPYAESTGDPARVPRAAYAVYNAGPRAVGRFSKPHAHPREQRVDTKLWTLYQAVAGGGEIDLASCGVKDIKAALR